MQFESPLGGHSEPFVRLCQESGISMARMAAAETEPLFTEWLSGNFRDVATPPLVLTVTETHGVTMPGAMRQLALSLCGSRLCGFYVLDFQIAPQSGLAWFDVTVVFRLRQHQDPLHAAREATKLVGTCLNVIPRLHAGPSAHRMVARVQLGSGDWRRPKLPACLGNVADFFPL